MGGSSNTTTTTSGGGAGAGGKDKDRDRARGSAVSFTEGEKVLAYHGPLLYEAKVQKTENREDEWRYFVHYLGWNKNWDEWVASDRLLKLTEENVRKQLELKNQSGDKTVRTGGRSAQHNPKGSNDAKADKEDTKGLVKGKKRKNQLGVEVAMIPKHEKERRSSESLLMSQFPVTLKKQLVDDWEFVTQLGKLVKLPRSPTVDGILTKYLEYRVKKDNKISDSCAEVTKGLRCYFDKALPAMLLYKKEQKQYKEEIKGDVSPSTVYGAEHLLRLFVKLPELLSSVNMEEDALNKLQQKLLDILKRTKSISSFLRTTAIPKAPMGQKASRSKLWYLYVGCAIHC
ncbi:unnamed protein product [Triticum aestivum]|uniref:Chromo domain-containing protein n=2 Tax=Triticinae TaxID=1648030 RepID=A0A7H4LAY4_WHEAT|nr:unnamed protein product [Triticum aestivum]